MSKLDEAIEYVEYEIAYYNDPRTYQSQEYYARCEAKAQVLGEVLYRLKELNKPKVRKEK